MRVIYSEPGVPIHSVAFVVSLIRGCHKKLKQNMICSRWDDWDHTILKVNLIAKESLMNE